MAHTILEQVLENVRQGAMVPALSASRDTELGPHHIEHLALQLLDDFEYRLGEAAAHVAELCQQSGLLAEHRQALLEHFRVAIANALSDYSSDPATPVTEHNSGGSGLLDEAPSHPGDPTQPSEPQHKALEELQEVLAAARTANQERDPQLIDELGDVAREYGSDARGRERNHEALADIHKMIEFLK